MFTGRIVGKEIAYNEKDELTVYLTEDRRVLLRDGNKLKYWQIDDPVEELRGLISPGEYAAACEALGVRAVVDL